VLVIAGRVRLHQAELEETVRAGSVIAVASRAEPGCICDIDTQSISKTLWCSSSSGTGNQPRPSRPTLRLHASSPSPSALASR
jgi:hypothetical protein